MGVVDQSRWRFVATDLSGRTTTGGGPVLNCSSKQFSQHLNAARVAQFTMNIDNPRSNFILSNDALLKVYRRTRLTNTWKLLMVGDIIHAEEDAQGDTGLVTVVASDPWFRLQRRLIGLATNSIGQGMGYTDGSSGSQVNYSNLILNMLNALNGIANTGLNVGTFQSSSMVGYIGPVYGQNVADMYQQLAATVGGPDLDISPIEPTGLMPSTKIGNLNIFATMGVNRPNTIFEYGTGKRNVATYARVLSKDGLANKIYSVPQGFPTDVAAGDGVVIAQDNTSINSIGLFEDVAQGSVASLPLRQELCVEYVSILRYARQQIVFTPTVDCPLDFTVDYNVGDTVTARAKVLNTLRYNGSVRLYGVDIQIDDNDAETPALTLIPGG